MLDRVKNFMPSWQRGLIQGPGRLILVKIVIAARPSHHLLVLDAPQWVFEEIDARMRSFFWPEKSIQMEGNAWLHGTLYVGQLSLEVWV